MADIEKLLEIMARLRHPETGCPWDQEQDFASIAPYTVEEADEVADAIERGDLSALREELGDLLLQVVYHARMAEEQDAFRFGDVVAAICDKMIRRHPHVFGDHAVADAREQTQHWEEHKARERAEKNHEQPGLLDDIPLNLPALVRARKLGHRAAKVGFDWPAVEGVLDKVREELGELEETVSTGGERGACEEELGDLLFALGNLGRHLDVDAEAALRRANYKFESRFRYIETQLGEQGKGLAGASLDEMEALWNEAKRAED